MAGTPTETVLDGGDLGGNKAISRVDGATPPPSLRDFISVDRSSCCVGDSVKITWEVHSRQLHERDFIGMFEVESSEVEKGGRGFMGTASSHIAAERLLDSRLRGPTSLCGGCLQWTLSGEIFSKNPSTVVQFCYCSHQELLCAQSDLVTVLNPSLSTPLPPSSLQRAISNVTSPIQIKISSLRCEGLRQKAYGLPDPYLRLHLSSGRDLPTLSHHNQQYISSVQYDTTDPSWDGEEFLFGGVATDVLEVEVRHKWDPQRPSVSHFLGKVFLPLSRLLSIRDTQSLVMDLQKRLPSDYVSGSISFCATSDYQLEGSEVIIPPQVSRHTTTPSLVASMSQDSCFSADEDHAPLLSVRSDSAQDALAHGDDIIPVVMATEIMAAAAPLPAHKQPLPPNLDRQMSEPLPPSIVRQVLSRSHLDHKGSAPLSRHQSLFDHSPQHYSPLRDSVPDLQPVEGTSVPWLRDFRARSERNLLSRQPSVPTLCEEERRDTQKAEGNITSEGVEHGPTSPILATQPNQLPTEASQTKMEDVTSRADVGVAGEELEVEDARTSEAGAGEGATVGHMILSREESVSEEVRNSPGFKFLTREDLYKFAKEQNNTTFFADLAVLQLIQTIRSDHTLYPRYQNSRKLVNLINSFARTDCKLPHGWEKRVDTSTDKVVFLDHTSCSTSYIDPRVPFPGSNLVSEDTEQVGVVTRSRPFLSPTGPTPSDTEHSRQRLFSEFSAPERQQSRPRASSMDPPSPLSINEESPSNYSERVVAFLRQPNIVDRLNAWSEGLSNSLREAVEQIQDGGTEALENLQTEQEEVYLDLTIILSLCEEEINHFTFAVSSRPCPHTSQVHRQPSPPPPPLPPPPPSPPLPSDHTFAGLSPGDIRSFFCQTRAYHRVLACFGGISAAQREFIEFASEASDGVMLRRLINDRVFRIFVHTLREEIGPASPSLSGSSSPSTSSGSSSPPSSPLSSPSLSSDRPLPPLRPPPSSDRPPLSSNGPPHAPQRPTLERGLSQHMFAGLPVRHILSYFVQMELSGVMLGQNLLLPLFSELSVTEFEEELHEDDRLLNLVVDNLDGIRDFVSAAELPAPVAPPPPPPPVAPPPPPPPVAPPPPPPPVAPPPPPPSVAPPPLSTPSILPPIQPPPPPPIHGVPHPPPPPPIPGVPQPPPPPIHGVPHPPPPPPIPGVPRPPPTRPMNGVLHPPPPPPLPSHPPPPPPLPSRPLLPPGFLPSNLSHYQSSSHFNRHQWWSRRQDRPHPPHPTTNALFVDKLSNLQETLEADGYAEEDRSPFTINVSRGQLLESAYRVIMTASTRELRSQKCYVSWDNEDGLDYGGPQREFFFLLSRQLFNPYYGLFEYSSHGSYTIQLSPRAVDIVDAPLWYRFAGRLIGYAIIHGQLLDVFFARHVYKSLLDRPFTVSDVEAVDVAFYNSLKYVVENDPAPLDLTFSVLEETFGEPSEYELKPGFGGVAVTEENKMEYVDLMVAWRLSRGISSQLSYLCQGLREMLPREYLEVFDSQELEWVIAGTAEINLQDWKQNTLYWGGYSQDHVVIKWFWEVVEAYSNELRLRLLQFVIGTSSIPFEGFRALKGSGTLQQFTIDILSDSNVCLPRSHTCFNRLDLPCYPTKKMLYDKLTLAVMECVSFENA